MSIVEREAAEKAMWSWYLEWSTIARVAIKERYILRALGFQRNQKADEGESEESDAVGDADEDAGGAARATGAGSAGARLLARRHAAVDAGVNGQRQLGRELCSNLRHNSR